MDTFDSRQIFLQLKKSETLLQTVINSTPDLIWTVDSQNYALLTFNQSLYNHFINYFGFRIKPGMDLKDLFPLSEKYQNVWNSLYRKVLREGSLITEYGLTYRGDRYLRLNLNLLKHDDVVFGISVFAQDITQIKRMENQLKDQLAEIGKLKSRLEDENIYLREEIKSEMGFDKIIGNSQSLQSVLFRAKQVAPTDATVLILGETGVGKGIIAHEIHQNSCRRDKAMVTVNCAALPANLIESELFGRQKGAFTSAHTTQAGRFEVANGGTIFLDEIGELPLELQAKLLRVLQEGEFERLGSTRTIRVDVRVIASTSRDLISEIRNGRFRQDLYYRLNTFPIMIPPLRMRIDDIPHLAVHFITKYSRKMGKKYEAINRDVMPKLQSYNWPGNVRELEHLIERAVITSPEPVFSIIDQLSDNVAVLEPIQNFEVIAREHILRVLQKTGWKVEGRNGAAETLGFKPSTLRFRIKKLGLKRP